MRKLTPSEHKILNQLIFPESYDVIQEETELGYGEIRDDIINLMNSRLIEVVDMDGSSSQNKILAFDSDNIKNSTYRITKSGINHIKKYI